jgi:hypothetical protein
VSKRIEIQGRKATKAHTFVLPMCSLNNRLLSDNFINSYILDDYLVLVFTKPEGEHYNYSKFINYISFNENFIRSELVEDEEVFYFKIPQYYLDDYEKFKQGLYSKFSDGFKELLIKHYGRVSIKENHTVTVYNTIYPQEFKRKQIAEHYNVDLNYVPEEVLDIPNLSFETYKSIIQLQEERKEKQIKYDNKQQNTI